MDTEELTHLLRGATDDLELREGFTKDVLRGGHRRRLRHRIAAATSAAAVIAVVGGATYAVVTDPGVTQNQVMAGWLESPTRGDLAGDQSFLNQAIAAWETGKSRSPNASAGIFDDLRGGPRVYWAGNTPAGRAAVVVQQAYLHPHENLPHGAADTLQTLVGLVAKDPADGRLKLVGDQFQSGRNAPAPGYFTFGPQNRVVLVVDRGEALWANHVALGFEPGEVPTEEELRGAWLRLPVRDGVAVRRFDTSRLPEFVASGRDPIADSAVKLHVVPAHRYLAAAETGGTGPLDARGVNTLGWKGEMRVGRPGGPDFPTEETFVAKVFELTPNGRSVEVGIEDSASNVPFPNYERWFVRAGLPDGRTAVLGDFSYDGKPYRFHVVLVNEDLSTERLDGDVVNINKTLPVRFRLPDEQGWLVAAKGTELSYRTSPDEGWRDAGKDAALLPDAAKQVMVDGKIVDLPH